MYNVNPISKSKALKKEKVGRYRTGSESNGIFLEVVPLDK